MSPDSANERYNPLALIGVTLLVLALFAVFFVSFLIAPLAILVAFYLLFAAQNRSRSNEGDAAPAAAAEPPSAPPPAPVPDPLAREAEARRAIISRQDETGTGLPGGRRA